MDVEKDIDIALSYIETNRRQCCTFEYNSFYEIYPFTTENLNAYFSPLGLENSSILTVGSSADQVLNAIAINCQDITCFDINPFVKYYYELKKASILCLSHKEFLDYFCYKNYPIVFKDNKKAFSSETYSKITPFLGPVSKYFWDRLYEEVEGRKIRANLFANDEVRVKALKKANLYLNEDVYYSCKDKLLKANPQFIKSDIRDVPSILNKKYDYIFLSNISLYLEYLFKNNLLQNWRQLVLKLSKYLNDNGSIFMAYLYDVRPNTTYQQEWAKIYDIDGIKEVFGSKNINIVFFRGIKDYLSDSGIKDAVITYKKI